MTDFDRGIAKWTSDKYNQTELRLDGIANNHAFFSHNENDVMVIGIAVPITENTILLNRMNIKNLIEKHNGSIQIAGE